MQIWEFMRVSINPPPFGFQIKNREKMYRTFNEIVKPIYLRQNRIEKKKRETHTSIQMCCFMSIHVYFVNEQEMS